MIVFCLLFAVQATEVSPVQKVLQLLDELKGKVTADVDNERKQFEENQAFCENETKEKNYAIKTAGRSIEGLQAAVEEADGNIQDHTSTVNSVSQEVAAKEQELSEATSNRHAEKKDFQAAEQELVDTIDTIARATTIIKKEMSLAQVKQGRPQFGKRLGALTMALSKIVDAAWMDSHSQSALRGFLQSAQEEDGLSMNTQPQANVSAYENHSGSIVSTLEDMKDKAEGALSDARKKEMQSDHAFALIKQGLNDKIKTLNDRNDNAKEQNELNKQAKGKAEGELARTQENKRSDEEYVRKLTSSCETRASEWQERQRTSSEELAAIQKAAEILSSGVKSLVQMSSSRSLKDDHPGSDRREQVSQLLRKMSREYQNFAMLQAANSAQSDPFVKVRGLIENMIGKLQDQANKDATHEAFCREEVAKTTKSRDQKTMRSDKFQARIDEAKSTMNSLQDSIRELEGEIASNDASQSSATNIRNQENSEYKKATQDYRESADAVARAVQTLKSYYESGSTPDKARGDAGHSIIEILEVAESDFTRLLAEAEAQEKSAQEAFDQLTKQNRESSLAKTTEVEGKQSEIKSLDVALMHHKEDRETVSKELDAVLAYLDKLKPDCESKAMSYEERKSRREAEINGLHEALEILSVEDAALIENGHFLSRVHRH